MHDKDYIYYIVYINYILDCKTEHCTCWGHVVNIGGTAEEWCSESNAAAKPTETCSASGSPASNPAITPATAL